MKKAIGALALFLLVALGLSTPAHAEVTTTCKTAPVHVKERPDSGEHGLWALGDFTRTTEACEVTPGKYEIKVTDEGEFVTTGPKSPGAGVPLAAGLRGTLRGGFTATLTAAPGSFNASAIPPTVEGTVHPTGGWVQEYFSDVSDVKTLIGWSWTYNLCGEKGEWWVNAEEGNRDDITGKACPTPSPSPSSPSPSPTKTTPSPTPSQTTPTHPTPSPSKSTQSPGTTPTHTGAPTDPMDPSTSTSAASGELPVTGPSSPIGVLAAGGVLILSGVGMLVGLRMRRKAIEG